METCSQKATYSSNQSPNSKIISAYSPKQKIQKTFVGEGRTKQSFKNECDINQILARFKRTGVLDFQQKMQPQYGDCTGIEFQEAQFIIAKANGMFAALPAHLRARFDNDPAKFLNFVNDKRNKNEAEDLGLLKEKENEAGQAGEAPLGAAPKPPANPTAQGGTPPSPQPKAPHSHQNPLPGQPGRGQGEG